MRSLFFSFLSLAMLLACSSSATGGNGAVPGDDGGTSAGGAEFQACDYRSENACASGQTCIGGICLTPVEGTCRPSDDGNDGCGDHELCVADSSGENRCFTLPDCPENGICPSGASLVMTCNTGAVKSKARVCIVDRCQSDADCGLGASRSCARLKPKDVIGHCNVGVPQRGSDGSGSWYEGPGCAYNPQQLVGTKPQGATCADPFECKPVCCSCGGGSAAMLASKCNLSPTDPSTGTCGSSSDACKAVFYSGNSGTCTAP
jgi:hypothetical protein